MAFWVAWWNLTLSSMWIIPLASISTPYTPPPHLWLLYTTRDTGPLVVHKSFVLFTVSSIYWNLGTHALWIRGDCCYLFYAVYQFPSDIGKRACFLHHKFTSYNLWIFNLFEWFFSVWHTLCYVVKGIKKWIRCNPWCKLQIQEGKTFSNVFIWKQEV